MTWNARVKFGQASEIFPMKALPRPCQRSCVYLHPLHERSHGVVEMQQAPHRLSQAIRIAFRASKPIHRPRALARSCSPHPTQPWRPRELTPRIQARFYSDGPRDVDRKVEDAKNRIEDALDSRAEAAAEPDSKLKDEREETIVHTNPESSSIVHPRSPSPSQDVSHGRPPGTSQGAKLDPLSTGEPSRTAQLRQRFGYFMDNFQTYIFSASRSLNDLTGYTSIEALKNTISTQEDLVMASRNAVKDARANYASAVATRSTTQREVNDLLHRKHAWTPQDLERFTSLYRSDHENEQSETAAQKEVSDAETRYEEASTKLARTILARYHEEQIWSDKIRQMSTWGTWGLMGLNVLLFVVFQIMIEPWRRRRLVKGFEEKVEVALRERDEQTRDMLMASTTVRPNGNAAGTPPAVAAEAGQTVDGMADHIAEQIVDAVSGTAGPSTTTPVNDEMEEAAETTTDHELASEGGGGGGLSAAFASTATGYAYYEEAFRELFSEMKLVVTQKEVTTVALEGAVGGAAVMGLLLVLLRPK